MSRLAGYGSALALALGVAVLAALAMGSRQVVAENRWPIQWIEVQGEFGRVSAEQVRASAVPALQDGFFGVDLEQVRERVEGLPWVRRAEVRKIWPDQLVVRVEEHKPVGQWNAGQLVSDRGEVFSVEGVTAIEGLPRFSGPEDAAAEVLSFHLALREQLIATGLDVVSLTLTPRGGWEARLSDGLQLVIGRDEPMARVERLVAAMDDLRLDPTRRPMAVDLRYTNGFAVRWQALDPPGELLATGNEVQP